MLNQLNTHWFPAKKKDFASWDNQHPWNYILVVKAVDWNNFERLLFFYLNPKSMWKYMIIEKEFAFNLHLGFLYTANVLYVVFTDVRLCPKSTNNTKWF